MKQIITIFIFMFSLFIAAAESNLSQEFTMENTALLIIDVQNDYFPGGRYELYKSLDASEKITRLLNYFRENKGEVIHIQHISINPGATFFLPDTDGINIHKSVTPLASEKIVVKHLPSSFIGTDLDKYLKSKGIKKLIITGMMTNMCVYHTSIDAKKNFKYEVQVISDCTAGKTSGLFDEYLDKLKKEIGNVTSLAEYPGK